MASVPVTFRIHQGNMVVSTVDGGGLKFWDIRPVCWKRIASGEDMMTTDIYPNGPDRIQEHCDSGRRPRQALEV